MDNNAKTNFLRNKKWYIPAAVFVFVLVFGLLMYKAGYRIKSNLTIGKVGVVFVETSFPLTSIFIDASKKITTSKDNEVVELSFSPKEHSLIVSHDGYFPWKKDFTVPSGGKIRLRPILVSQNATGEIITQKDPEYWKIRNMVSKSSLPTKDSPKISADGQTSLWLEDNTVTVSTASTTKVVIEPDTSVRNVDFYKNRDEVVIFSTSNYIYAIETESDGGQNFMPIYRGENPMFIVNGENSIYVLDGENLMEVII